MTIQDVRFVKGASRWEHLPTDGIPEVAFIGRSNVGKSSLINMVLGRAALARISRTPGKTQEFNYYLVNDCFYLVDLPGYGYAKVSQVQRAHWSRLIGRYLAEREPLRAVFHLIDSRHLPMAQDREVMAMMRGQHVPYVVLLTKTDKLSGNLRVKARAEVEKVLLENALEAPCILTSAKDKRGRMEILEWLDSLVRCA